MHCTMMWFFFAAIFILLEVFSGAVYLGIIGIVCIAIGTMKIMFYVLPMIFLIGLIMVMYVIFSLKK